LYKGGMVGRSNPACHAEPAQVARNQNSSPTAQGGNLSQTILALCSLGCCLWLLGCLALGCGGAATYRVDLRKDAVKLNDEGYQYYRESRWRLARSKFTEALKLNRLIDHRQGIASNLNNLGAVAQEQGQLDEAENYYRNALTIQQEIGDGAGICEALNNLGTVYASRGRWAEAGNLYRQALGYVSSQPRSPLLALTLTHQGDVARHQKNYQQALDLYQQALAIDTKGKNKEGQAVRWGRLGRTYLEMSDYASSGQYLHMSLDEFRRLQRTNGIIDALDGLVALALAQGDRPEAQVYGERLLKIYQARGQTREAERLEALLKKPVR
jgi:tetratricopeptide (TPR) repeat protein